MAHPNEDPLTKLAIFYPDLAKKVKELLAPKIGTVPVEDMALLVEETLWALSEEISFGQAVALGYASLIGETGRQMIERYGDLVREFGQKGPTLGRIIAIYLAPVCGFGDQRLLKKFLHALDVMLAKGSYTLEGPLKVISKLLNAHDIESASAFLDLTADVFAEDLSYVQCQHFALILPRAVLGFAPSRRLWQIRQLQRVIRANIHLADPFLEGFEKGLHLLSREALHRFVSLGIAKLGYSRRRAMKFLSLESKLGSDTFADMQVTVPLSQVQGQLNSYLRARTGQALSVRPLSELSDAVLKADRKKTLVCSAGTFIYLPSEISKFDRKEKNIKLYKCLARLEAGHFEYRTFDFDLEKALERGQRILDFGFWNGDINGLSMESDLSPNLKSKTQNYEKLCDLERFFKLFPIPALAADLFTVFEHGRIRVLLDRCYPGLVRQTTPILQQEAARMMTPHAPVEVVFLLYITIALGADVPKTFHIDKNLADRVAWVTRRFEEVMAADPAVEAGAELVLATYADVERLLRQGLPDDNREDDYESISTPFGRKIRPDLFFSTYRNLDQIAARLQDQLKNKGLRIYRSDIRRHLIAANGVISHEDIESLILSDPNNRGPDGRRPQAALDLSWLDLSKLLGSKVVATHLGDVPVGPVFWYSEWDCNLQDYLSTHVRVLDRTMAGSEENFYNITLNRHRGLITSIRYAFELLKPEGLVRLRQWVEGDEFDYRALLDFAIDKKAGRIPSDRLYIKRIKQTRDVAVLLLVDLSRSTANTVNGSQSTVLEVEKEAIVLFCEALEVVEDTFAIAGFSGTGRLGVDYLRIKDFDETLDDNVKQRINAMHPRRSTRMGAAIRHATCQLEKVPAKVRLLIILGDGFPNDVDYKQDYAIHDTSKAIFEAHSKDIYTHAIIVNMAADPKLDDLFGNVHHNVISDVRELPEKLLRIYGGLTRY